MLLQVKSHRSGNTLFRLHPLSFGAEPFIVFFVVVFSLFVRNLWVLISTFLWLVPCIVDVANHPWSNSSSRVLTDVSGPPQGENQWVRFYCCLYIKFFLHIKSYRIWLSNGAKTATAKRGHQGLPGLL